MNQYPAWKYLFLVALIAFATLYATPNLYGEDPAVQVTSAGATGAAGEEMQGRVERLLSNAGIEPKTVELREEQVLARFNNGADQLKGKEVIESALGSEYAVALNLAPATPGWLRDWGAAPMYLGLDLRGGIHFLMQIDMDGSIKSTLESYEGEIRSLLREERLRNRGARVQGGEVIVRFSDEETRETARGLLMQRYEDLEFIEREQDGDPVVVARFTDKALLEEKRSAVTQNISALRNRVNALGVSEPVIQQQGLDRIVVQLPGVQDSAKARELLGSTATLEYRMQYGTYQDARSVAGGSRLPTGAKLYQERDGSPILLERSIIVTGDNIQNAAVTYDENNQPAVRVTLNGNGADRMYEVTKENVREPMAVVYKETKFETRVVDGEEKRVGRQEETVISVATVREPLSKQFITTGLRQDEAANLAILLRSGALKAPMEIIEERTIGPSLGAENIDKGLASVVIGLCLVLVFMAFYYKVFGLIANLALITNIVMIVAVMSLLQATLTLPGIAGIVLTVGMAVDANVLIFERIKEELKRGVKIQEAIYQGYDKAFSTIADANVTTFIAAVILFTFGTGPIKGFAITLSIGIATSMLTAIMGTRSIVNWIYGNRRIKSLPLSWSFLTLKDTHIPFMRGRYLSLLFSALLIGASIAGLAHKGLTYGIDFTGGYLVEVGYQEPADLEGIRSSLAQGGFDDAMVQNFGTSRDVLIRIQPREGMESVEVSEEIMSQLRGHNPEVEQRRIEFVGPQVGEELRESGGMAMLFALIAIVIYLAFRFQIKFSFGAVAALIHDVLITLGVFAWTGIEFDLTVLAALLAVIGYSLNDTIVVYDRIRENFSVMRRGQPIDIMNTSINQMLSRTLMTSITTIFVLLALFYFGGEIIHAFALALLVGVLIGTYSSVFIASTGLVFQKLNRQDLLPPEDKEDDPNEGAMP
ncbi:MAG: protein translocase subunit SecD [Pseudomonadota bacterium]